MLWQRVKDPHYFDADLDADPDSPIISSILSSYKASYNWDQTQHNSSSSLLAMWRKYAPSMSDQEWRFLAVMGKNQDPGSGINIPGPQHCIFRREISSQRNTLGPVIPLNPPYLPERVKIRTTARSRTLILCNSWCGTFTEIDFKFFTLFSGLSCVCSSSGHQSGFSV
jgi:hypothetical protein